MDTNRDLLRRLDHEWERIANSAAGRRAVRRWGSGDPLFDGIDSLGELVDRINERGHQDQSDAILLALLRRCPTDDLAGRTVLQAMMPTVKRLTTKFMTCGVWSADETAAVAVAAMWERIRTYPIERRPTKVSANLTLDTRQRVWRTGYKQIYGHVPRSSVAA